LLTHLLRAFHAGFLLLSIYTLQLINLKKPTRDKNLKNVF